MNQSTHDNGAFQPDDQPHFSHSVEPCNDIDQASSVGPSESCPLLNEGRANETVVTIQNLENTVNELLETNPRLNGAQTVICRVCENQIVYQDKSMLFVVKCPACDEVTPIRSAPTGKKFVRCPCNCLLICKMSSHRIACPRHNCGRVIILKPTTTNGASVPAPTGTARIGCFHCEGIFVHNMIANYMVQCPHCLKQSSISLAYTRSRAFLYFICTIVAIAATVILMLQTIQDFSNHAWVIIIYVALLVAILLCSQRFAVFIKLKTSQILGPM